MGVGMKMNSPHTQVQCIHYHQVPINLVQLSQNLVILIRCLSV